MVALVRENQKQKEKKKQQKLILSEYILFLLLYVCRILYASHTHECKNGK